jgi:hypothetical protein
LPAAVAAGSRLPVGPFHGLILAFLRTPRLGGRTIGEERRLVEELEGYDVKKKKEKKKKLVSFLSLSGLFLVFSSSL